MNHLPGFEISARLHSSSQTQIYRARRIEDNRVVILKTPATSMPSPVQIRRIRREFQLGRMVQSEFVLKYLDIVTMGRGAALVLEDFQGESLASLVPINGMALAPFLTLAIHLTEGLEAIHRAGIVHKDIKPSNILMNSQTGQIKIIDFGIASELDRERHLSLDVNTLEGTLAYISPEQTGRMNRTLDYRTDFYSLGVTLYELLLGHRPFIAEDHLELIHCHLARVPKSPDFYRPEVSSSLSAIVLKLLAKEADARYQSSSGLLADLERCRRELEQDHRTSDFQPGLHDFSDRFHVPDMLFGRSGEVAQLLESFERSKNGGREFLMISGDAGVGKSALVNEVRRPVTACRGFFIIGKCEDHNREVPYHLISMAFRDLIIQILGFDETVVRRWRERVLRALGPNGRVIADVIPEIELLIGSQDPLPVLEPEENRQRFSMMFRNFVGTFSMPEHPLVIFLDDLQWIDPASLDLLDLFLTDEQLRCFMIIGAMRHTHLEQSRQVSDFRTFLEDSGVPVSEIHLAPLNVNQVTAMISQTLMCTLEQASPLSEVIAKKTDGNPFFVIELLRSLYRDGFLRYMNEEKRWGWDIEEVKKSAVSDNVAGFLVYRLRQLSEETQTLLQLAACFGNTFTLRGLCVIREMGPVEVSRHLWSAIREEIVVPLNEDYKLVELQDPETASDLGVSYRFHHDRIQHAAWSLTSEKDRSGVHLHIGRRLFQAHSPVLEGENLLEIVYHLNHGSILIKDRQEKLRLAALNLESGQKAMASIAWRPAARFLEKGVSLLDEEAWTTHYPLCWELYLEFAEVCFLCQEHGVADRLSRKLAGKAKSLLDKAIIAERRLDWNTISGTFAYAYEDAVAILSQLRIKPPSKTTRSQLFKARVSIGILKRKRPISSLADGPEMKDPLLRISMKLLSRIALSCYLRGEYENHAWCILKRVQLAIRHGKSPEAAHAYAAYGCLLCGMFEDYAEGYAFGELARRLVFSYPFASLKCRVLVLEAIQILPWNAHWSKIDVQAREAVREGRKGGDLIYMSMALPNFYLNPALELSTVVQGQRNVLATLEEIGQGNQESWGRLQYLFFRNLAELPLDPLILGETQEAEEELLRRITSGQEANALAAFHFYKTLLAWFFYQEEQCLEHFAATRKVIHVMQATTTMADWFFFSYLVLARYHGKCGPNQANEMAEALNKMKKCAEHCPANFLHRYLLMKAERARLNHQYWKASGYFDKSAEEARKSGWLRDEGLIHELAARFHLERGHGNMGAYFLQRSYQLYLHWGAETKARQMKYQHPNILADLGLQPAALSHYTSAGNRLTSGGIMPSDQGSQASQQVLDLKTVVKASMAISREIDYQKLLTKMMGIILESAGAESGILFIEDDGRPRVEAAMSEGEVKILQSLPLDECKLASRAIVRYVFRTGKTLVLRDPVNEGFFSNDPYVKEKRPKSVLGIPVRAKDRVFGVFYLENNLATDVFSEKRVALLELLVTQASISLENALLFSNISEAETKVRKLNRDLETLNEALEHRVSERTTELERTQAELVEKAHQAGMADIATSVLHNVGNLLNSVLTSCHMLEKTVNQSRVKGIIEANKLLRPQMENYQEFFNTNEKAYQLLQYYLGLDRFVVQEREILGENISRLIQTTNTIREVVMDQEMLATRGFRDESVSLPGVVENVLNIEAGFLARHRVSIAKNYSAVPPVIIQRTKFIHVMVNVLRNAAEAMDMVMPQYKVITITVGCNKSGPYITLSDPGEGIDPLDLDQIFALGYTTRPSKRGFGLHWCANAMTEMGGTISTVSQGKGMGASFSLQFYSQPVNS